MSNWEYKVITSGKGGFASPALLEKFLNDLGQESWEIISFQTQPDNLLAFTGLVRRPTQRDWTLEDAAAAAARAEADKLRAEFEAKFRAASSNAAATAAAEDKAEVFLAEEKPGADDGLRRLVDTSRDQDPDAPEDEAGGEKDEWDKLSSEDELPTFFEALRPHMRRNQRGPGMSVGVDYLAKKWKLEEADIKGALVECGLQIPADENAKPVFVEFEGDLFWVNINRRGEIWINTREKPQPVFRIVPGTPVAEGDTPAEAAPEPRREPRREPRPAPPADSSDAGAPEAADAASAAPKTFLDRIRSMMRRNRRGHGWSGSFAYLTKALRTDDAGLLAQLAETGLKLKEDGAEKPLFHEENGFLYWMDKNARGEIWINTRRARDGAGEAAPEGGAPAAETAAPESAPAPAAADTPAPAPVAVSAPASAPGRVPAHTLEALRLLLQPKKRGDGFTAKVDDLAAQLGRPAIEILEALVAAGLNVPEDAKDKPRFGECNGEIFWLNRNARDELWLNAKDAKATRGRGRRKPADGVAEDAPEESSADPAE
jgi:hypothetical protein